MAGICHKVKYIIFYDLATVKWLLTLGEVKTKWLRDAYLAAWTPTHDDIARLLHTYMSPKMQLVALHMTIHYGLKHQMEWLLTHGEVQISPQHLATIVEMHAPWLNFECMQYLAPWISTYIQWDAQLVTLAKYRNTGKKLDIDDVSILDAEALSRLVLQHQGDVLTLVKADAMSNVDFQATMIAKQCLANFYSGIISDLAPDLDDVSLLEFVLLTKSDTVDTAAELVQMLRMRGQSVDTITTRWQHYFVAGTDKRYACQDGHSNCYTQNLWIQYYHTTCNDGARYIWQNGWFHSQITQVLESHMR